MNFTRDVKETPFVREPVDQRRTRMSAAWRVREFYEGSTHRAVGRKGVLPAGVCIPVWRSRPSGVLALPGVSLQTGSRSASSEPRPGYWEQGEPLLELRPREGGQPRSLFCSGSAVAGLGRIAHSIPLQADFTFFEALARTRDSKLNTSPSPVPAVLYRGRGAYFTLTISAPALGRGKKV